MDDEQLQQLLNGPAPQSSFGSIANANPLAIKLNPADPRPEATLGGALQGVLSAPGLPRDALESWATGGSDYPTWLQQHGLGDVPSAWIGSALHTLADPTLAVGGFMDALRGGRGTMTDVPLSSKPMGAMPEPPWRMSTPSAAEMAEAANKADYAFANPARPTGANQLADARARLEASPDYARVMKQMPQGSQYQGGGQEADVFRTPGNNPDAFRIGYPNGDEVQAAAMRLPEINQPFRDMVIGNTRVSFSPFAEKTGSLVDPAARSVARGFENSLRARGYDPFDVTAPNVGWVKGQPFITDPNAVQSGLTTHRPWQDYMSRQVATPGRPVYAPATATPAASDLSQAASDLFSNFGQ